MNFPPDRIDTDAMEHFTAEQEDVLLHTILSDLHIEKSIPPVSEKISYRAVVRRKYIIRKCCIAACVALLLFMLMPGTVVPAPISKVSAAPAADSSSARVEFSVTSAVPVREVSAQMNDQTIQVEETSYQKYAVDVRENGYLLLEVYSISGMYSSQKIEIDSIDDKSPAVVSHYQSGDTIVITFTDNNGVGIDYPSITCYSPETGISSGPLYYDERTGQVIFLLPNFSEFISVPDKNGNTLTLMLSSSSGGDSPN